MKFLLDENVPKSTYTEMQKRCYDVHILFVRRGLKDREIIEIANSENRTTQDEDLSYLNLFKQELF